MASIMRMEGIKISPVVKPSSLEGSNDIDQQILELKTRCQDALSVESKSNLDFQQKLVERNKNLYSSDREVIKQSVMNRFDLKELPGHLQLKGASSLNNETGVIYDFTTERTEEWELSIDKIKSYYEKTGIPVFNHMFNILDSVNKDYQKLVASSGKDDPRKNFFKLHFTRGETMSTPLGAGAVVNIGEKQLNELYEALEAGDYERYQDISAGIASQYFHEQLHHSADETMLDTGTFEEFTMLGEFLYDPLHNKTRNQMFSNFGHNAFYEEQRKANSKWDTYHSSWKYVGLPILLNELVERGVIDTKLLSNNPDNLIKIADALPNYFALISKEERMSIVAKYAKTKKNELYELGSNITGRLNLSFELPSAKK